MWCVLSCILVFVCVQFFCCCCRRLSSTLWFLSMVQQQSSFFLSFFFFLNLFVTAGNSVLYPLGMTWHANGAVWFTCTDSSTWLPCREGHSFVTLGKDKSLFFSVGWKLYVFFGLCWVVYTSAQSLCCRNVVQQTWCGKSQITLQNNREIKTTVIQFASRLVNMHPKCDAHRVKSYKMLTQVIH